MKDESTEAEASKLLLDRFIKLMAKAGHAVVVWSDLGRLTIDEIGMGFDVDIYTSAVRLIGGTGGMKWRVRVPVRGGKFVGLEYVRMALAYQRVYLPRKAQHDANVADAERLRAVFDADGFETSRGTATRNVVVGTTTLAELSVIEPRLTLTVPMLLATALQIEAVLAALGAVGLLPGVDASTFTENGLMPTISRASGEHLAKFAKAKT